jgi:hydrogenase nickel incorporation protein HypA/HybF
MHELAIAQDLVRQARLAARAQAGGRRVSELHVEIGELSGVVPLALREAFPLAAEGTELNGTKLRIKRIKVRFQCRACGGGFGLGAGVGCPRCGSSDVDMVHGREICLTALEVVEGEEAEA